MFEPQYPPCRRSYISGAAKALVSVYIPAQFRNTTGGLQLSKPQTDRICHPPDFNLTALDAEQLFNSREVLPPDVVGSGSDVFPSSCERCIPHLNILTKSIGSILVIDFTSPSHP